MGKGINVGFNCSVKNEDYLYFSEYESNGLYRLNLETENVEYLTSFTGEDNCHELYRRCLLIEGKIYFAPYRAKEMAVYNINSNSVCKYSLREPMEIIDLYEEEVPLENMPIKFSDIFSWGKYIFMIGFMYPAIVRINQENGEMKYITEPVKNLKRGEKIKIKDRYIKDVFFRDGVAIGEFLYLPSFLSNQVLKFNMGDLSYEFIDIPYKTDGFGGLSMKGNDLWIPTKKCEAVIKYNLENRNCTVFPLEFRDEIITYQEGLGTLRPVFYGDKVIITSMAMECFWMIDEKDEKAKIIQDLMNRIGIDYRLPILYPNIIINSFIDKDNLIFISSYDMAVYKYDMKKSSLEKVYLQCNVDDSPKFDSPKFRQKKEVIRERVMFALNDFIKYIQEWDDN